MGECWGMYYTSVRLFLKKKKNYRLLRKQQVYRGMHTLQCVCVHPLLKAEIAHLCLNHLKLCLEIELRIQAKVSEQPVRRFSSMLCSPPVWLSCKHQNPPAVSSAADRTSLWYLVNFSSKFKNTLGTHVSSFRSLDHDNSLFFHKEGCVHFKRKYQGRQIMVLYTKEKTFESLPGSGNGPAGVPLPRIKEAVFPSSCRRHWAHQVVLSDRWGTRRHHDQYRLWLVHDY